jgi:hypothetical protein
VPQAHQTSNFIPTAGTVLTTNNISSPAPTKTIDLTDSTAAPEINRRGISNSGTIGIAGAAVVSLGLLLVSWMRRRNRVASRNKSEDDPMFDNDESILSESTEILDSNNTGLGDLDNQLSQSKKPSLSMATIVHPGRCVKLLALPRELSYKSAPDTASAHEIEGGDVEWEIRDEEAALPIVNLIECHSGRTLSGERSGALVNKSSESSRTAPICHSTDRRPWRSKKKGKFERVFRNCQRIKPQREAIVGEIAMSVKDNLFVRKGKALRTQRLLEEQSQDDDLSSDGSIDSLSVNDSISHGVKKQFQDFDAILTKGFNELKSEMESTDGLACKL